MISVEYGFVFGVFFMVKKCVDKGQSKLGGIVRLESNVPVDHIARFVVDFY
jgi:hypothetical protein